VSGRTSETFDYVIAGGGTAGCVLAARLSEDASKRVLLLEAGPRDWHPFIHIPAGFLKLLDAPSVNWRYRTEASPHTGSRVINFPRGKVLGGSSSINGLVYARGHASDFDHWAQSGCRGWAYDDVLPYFRKSERYAGGDARYRGQDGPLDIVDYDEKPEITEAMVAAGRRLGYPVIDDHNAAEQEGISYYQMTRRGRWRANAARAFLGPAARRANLVVRTGALVERIVLEDRRAVGVDYVRGGREHTARAAAETIVSAGAVGSPQILQLSGIGDPEGLAGAGIEPRIELPGVGENLQDHYAARLSWRVIKPGASFNDRARGLALFAEIAKFIAHGSGITTYSSGVLAGFLKSSPDVANPDLQFVVVPGSFAANRLGALDVDAGMTVGVYQLRPESRGHIRATSPDPKAPPVIQPNYLAAPKDCDVLVTGLRMARDWVGQPDLDALRDGEILPGPAVESDEALLDYVRAYGSTVYHPVGTCRMGGDAMAVVDDTLRVRGVADLRVVDASIMPRIVSANTNAATMMIAEKAADMIRGRSALAVPEPRGRETVLPGVAR